MVALWISYSRSALVAGILTVLIVVFVTVFRKLPRRVWITGFIVLCALAGALIASKGSSFVANVLLHENPNGGSSVSSNEGHVESIKNGISEVIHQPLGSGVGSTGSASLFGGTPTIVENQYLFVAHEAGWLGLLVFMTLFVTILVRLWHSRTDWLSLGVFAGGIGLGAIGLLLPVWADDTVSIVWWGLAAIALTTGETYARKQTK
jgi:energy-coupling factor transporter transmembrane protein EcfT